MDNYIKMLDIIKRYSLDGEAVLQLLTDWNGTSIIDDSFMENLVDGSLLIVRVKSTLLDKYTLWVSNLCADTITEPVTTNATITNNIVAMYKFMYIRLIPKNQHFLYVTGQILNKIE